MKILIAEDQTPIIHTLEVIIDELFPTATVFSFDNLTEALNTLDQNQIEFIISDLDFKEGKRFDLIKEAKDRKIPCIVYTLYHNKVFTDEAKRNKAKYFVCKRGPIKNIKSAIKNYQSDGFKMCPTTIELQSEAKSVVTERIIFSTREQQILEGLMDGLSFSEISNKLNLKYSTIKSYARDMISKHNMPLKSLIANYLNWNHRQ